MSNDCEDVVQRRSQHIIDEWLVLAAQDGEAGAFAALFAKSHPMLMRHAIRLTGGRDAGEDVTQEAWLAIVRGLGRLDDPVRFRAWALRIVTHKAADWIRRRMRDRTLKDSIESREPRSVSSDFIGEARIESGERTQKLKQAMSQLDSGLIAVIGLHYGENLSVSEIADVLDVPAGTVKSRLHTARSRLKELMERNES